MASLVYTPDEDVKVHEEGAIRLICAPFQSHENGLPEWIKNSADEYARTGRSEEGRIIIVVLNDGRHGRGSSISCVDFCGMTSAVIENHFRRWADPDAALRGTAMDSVQGGHGNGGKCYMCQMFDRHALIHTVKNNLGNRYGVAAGSVKFGYVPSKAAGRDFKVNDTLHALREALTNLGCDWMALPEPVRKMAEASTGFTIVSGFGPKGLSGRAQFTALISHLQDHAQMIRTLEFCRVCVILNGKAWNDGKPLSLPQIPPLPGGEAPRVIDIPETLIDPAYNNLVSTTDKGKLPQGRLTLRTSDRSMRWGRKARHTINFKANSGFIGYVPVPDLDVQSPFRDNIYGECALESLEPFKQNDRGLLADAPLSRAVRAFLCQEISKYAKEFEAKEKKQYDQKEKSELSRINEALDRWKNQFLETLLSGRSGKGIGVVPPGPVRLPSGKVTNLVISLSHTKAGVGVSLKPSIEFYDAKGRRVRPVPFEWVSEDTNVAMVDEDLAVVNTFAVGTTRIWAQTADGKVTSNKAVLEVVHIRAIDLTPVELELEVGSRRAFEAVCTLASGDESKDVYLEWIEDNPKVARVGPAGVAFAYAPGECKITAGDDHATAGSPAVLRVVPATAGGRTNGKGRGYPRILISSIDNDPDTNQPVHLSKDYPPVYQSPQDYDRNIWWINSSAPIAGMLLDKDKGYGYRSREWRMYHLERYIEVLIQIALTYSAKESPNATIDDYLVQWGMRAAEIQAVAVSSLTGFITDGTLPSV